MRWVAGASLGLIFGIGGCKQRPLYNPYRVGPIAESKAINTQDGLLWPTPINLDVFRFPEDGEGCPTAYAKAVRSSIYRDRLRDILVMRADQMYDRHRANALAFSAGTNASFDLAQTLVAGVGALTTGGTTPRILSGTASMIGATKAIVLEAAYFRVFVPKLLQDTEKERRAALDAIYAHTDEPIEKYSIDRMIRDVLVYHESGSLYLAIIRLAQQEPTTRPAGSTEDIPPPVPATEQTVPATTQRTSISTTEAVANPPGVDTRPVDSQPSERRPADTQPSTRSSGTQPSDTQPGILPVGPRPTTSQLN